LNVLHLVGSSETEYYANLSLLWARGSVNALQHRVTDCMHFHFAVVHPRDDTLSNDPLDALWSFPSDLSESSLSNAPRYRLAEATKRVQSLSIDCTVTHMHDRVGTEVYRSLLDDLGIPFIGSSAETMKIANNKQSARTLVASHGVPTPKGFAVGASVDFEGVLERMALHGVAFPVVVKPVAEDNSFGLSLVESRGALQKAVAEALRFGHEAVIEEYVALGREIRIGIVETADGGEESQEDTKYVVLPLIEYHLSPQHPIRTNNDKFTKNAKGHSEARCSIDCEVDRALRTKLEALARTAHRALGARDFSLFDVRVDPEGNPFFIEANLYWSFSSKSILTLMAEATGDREWSHSELFKSVVQRVAKRTRKKRARKRSKL